MQAIVLTAGFGRRMRPLSDHRHKALLSIGGTTILGRIMDALDSIAVERVTVVTGYRAEDVEGFLRSTYPQMDLRFVRNTRFETTNNIVSLSMALDAMTLDDDVLLTECDLLFDPLLLQRLVERSSGNVALLDRYRTGMDGTVVSVVDGMISQVFPPSSQGADFDYSDKFKTLNIYRFDATFCRTTLKPLMNTYANQIDDSCYYELVVGMLVSLPQYRVAAELVSGDRWVEVDDPNDLEVARFRFEPDARAEVLDRAWGGHWNYDILDFSFMRNAYFPTPAMLAAMRHALPELVGSYPSSQVILNEKMSRFLHCSDRHVQVLHGASQVYPMLATLFSTGRAAYPSPTFGEYPRWLPDAAAYADRPGVDWDEVERMLPGLELLVVVNPNTPAGTVTETHRLLDLARRHPLTTFLVDESFLPFSGQPSLVGLLEQEPLENVVVLTSLSKSLGAPGLRLGFLYSRDERLVGAVGERLPIWNLPSPAEFLLELLLKFDGPLQESITKTIDDREALRADLGALDLVEHVYPSGGNYLLARLAPHVDVPALRRTLLAGHNIEIKDVTSRYAGGRPHVRIGVRTQSENEQLLKALAAIGAP